MNKAPQKHHKQSPNFTYSIFAHHTSLNSTELYFISRGHVSSMFNMGPSTSATTEINDVSFHPRSGQTTCYPNRDRWNLGGSSVNASAPSPLPQFPYPTLPQSPSFHQHQSTNSAHNRIKAVRLGLLYVQ